MKMLPMLPKDTIHFPINHASGCAPKRWQSAVRPFAALLLLFAATAGCQKNAEAVGDAAQQAADVKSDEPAGAPATATQEETQVAQTASSRATPGSKLTVKKSPFGKLEDGRPVTLFTCNNKYGLTLKMIDYGAIVVTLETLDRTGKRENINLGFDNLEGYIPRHPYFGSTVGRYANRIAGAKFTLDGEEYTLFANDGANHLHGGKAGLDKVLWEAEPIESTESVGIRFTYTSPDGEEGYPGNLRIVTTYIINNNNELKITFDATTDKPTPVNLTNHNYWNLAGAGNGTILDQELTINADKYLPVDAGLIPTGELADVAGTPLDFRKPRKVGERIKELTNTPQGYDHCFVLNEPKSGEDMRLAARVRDPKSGRVMEIYTTQPAIQFYSGNFLDGQPASGGYPQYAALCLETQHYPDSPNQEKFPNTILRPGEEYHHETVHKFSVE